MAPRAALLAVLLAAPALAGCAAPGPPFAVVVSSPILANGMTVLVANAGGIFGGASGQASYEIRYNGEIVFPPGGVGGVFEVRDGKGAVFLPYNHFVVGNGEYEVRLRFDGREVVQATKIDKWVSFVYVQAYCGSTKNCAYNPNGRITVDTVLEASPGLPNARVLAAGTLDVELRYRGENKERNDFALAFSQESAGERSFVRLEVPMNRFSAKSGWYSVEATFHNAQALGNAWVRGDPAMSAHNPPANWFHLEV